MYIPDFWAGVSATIGVELFVIIVYGIYKSVKK